MRRDTQPIAENVGQGRGKMSPIFLYSHMSIYIHAEQQIKHSPNLFEQRPKGLKRVPHQIYSRHREQWMQRPWNKSNHDVYQKEPIYNFELHTALYGWPQAIFKKNRQIPVWKTLKKAVKTKSASRKRRYWEKLVPGINCSNSIEAKSLTIPTVSRAAMAVG